MSALEKFNLPSASQQKQSVLDELNNADTPQQVADILQLRCNVSSEFLDYLKDYPAQVASLSEFAEKLGVKYSARSAKAKLLELYHEVLLFDLTYGTSTSNFISEALYRQLALDNPDKFIFPDSAQHGVKHRPSLTSSIITAFNEAVAILQRNGLENSEVTFIEPGAGMGKASLIAASPVFSYEFGKVIGYDYLSDVVEDAENNARSSGLKIDPQKIHFIHADARDFGKNQSYGTGYNGINVVYIYNPFDREIVEPFERRLRKNAGKVILLYCKPLHADVFDKADVTREDGSPYWRRAAEVKNQDPDKHILVFTSPGLD